MLLHKCLFKDKVHLSMYKLSKYIWTINGQINHTSMLQINLQLSNFFWNSFRYLSQSCTLDCIELWCGSCSCAIGAFTPIRAPHGFNFLAIWKKLWLSYGEENVDYCISIFCHFPEVLPHLQLNYSKLVSCQVQK